MMILLAFESQVIPINLFAQTLEEIYHYTPSLQAKD